MSDTEKIFSDWKNGESFEIISKKNGISLQSIVSKITVNFNYRLTDYCISTNGTSRWGNVCAIKEINNVIESYRYKEKKDPCYSLMGTGIYKRNEDTFRKLAKSFEQESLRVIKGRSFKKVFSLYNNIYDGNLLQKENIEAKLNRIPSEFKLLETYLLKELDQVNLFGIFEVPTFSIY